MNGKELIDKICEILDNEGIRLYDYQILKKITELTEEELKTLINVSRTVVLGDLPHVSNLICPNCGSSLVEKMNITMHCTCCDHYW